MRHHYAQQPALTGQKTHEKMRHRDDIMAQTHVENGW